jgi:hypothetical protein
VSFPLTGTLGKGGMTGQARNGNFREILHLEQAHWKDLVQETGNMPAGQMREGLKSPESKSGTGGNGECPRVEAGDSRTR